MRTHAQEDELEGFDGLLPEEDDEVRVSDL